LVVAPVTMRHTLTKLVEREIACRRRGERGHIILKMNGLVDHDIVQLLYRASQAGVDVDLLVRSICCLRPGLPGVSDRIRVCSIVGRFLEHSRVWYFRNGGHEEVYIGSADLMPRNLDRRIEIMAPVKDSGLRRRVLNILRMYLVDTVKARELRADGRYVRVKAGTGEHLVDAQLALLHEGSTSSDATADKRTSSGGRHRHLSLVRDSTGRDNATAE
jgi:polyphosphate kinase